MNVVVRRLEVSSSGLSQVGELLIDDEHLCWTLERGPGVPDHPPIPVGSYDARLSVSPRLKYLCPEVLAVPGRTGIRIHSANFWHQLEGCTAVGLVRGHEKEELAVYESRAALAELLRVLPTTFVITYS